MNNSIIKRISVKHRLAMKALLLCAAMLLVSAGAQGKAQTAYKSLITRTEGLPSAEIMRLADREDAAGREDSALVLYIMVCNRFSDRMTEEEKHACSLAYCKAGNIYFNRGNYVNALENEVKGLKISESAEHPVHAARLYNNIGNVYGVFLDYEKSINYYTKAYELCRKYPNKELEYKILVNLTGMYIFTEDNAKAMKYYRLSERLKNAKDPVNMFMSSYMLGLIQINEKKYNQAAARFISLAGYAKRRNLEPKYLCFAYQSAYQAFSGTGRRDSVLKYLDLCDKTAKKHNMQHMFAETLKDYSDFYEKEGDIATANRYKAMYLNLKDSIYDMREFDIVKNTQFQYELDKTTKEFEEMHRREAERLQTIRFQRIIIAIAAVCMLVVGAFLLIVYIQKKRLNRSYKDIYSLNRTFIEKQKDMAERNRRDREALKEKDREIAELNRKITTDGTARTEEPKETTKTEKYQTSNLNLTQQQALAEAITNVMENTQEFCSPDFSLDTLASLVGSNSKYVSQVINNTFNKNFNSYINTYRIHLACLRLTDIENFGRFTLKGISESVGFKSHTSFVNVFKKIIGITPSMYQSMAKQEEKAIRESELL